MHKDIKGQNLLFDNQGYVKICDFGMAESTKPLKPGQKQNFGGTWRFMAPEIISHKKHEASVDYYALGVMVYECMLQKPFPIPSKEKVKKILKEGGTI